MLDTAKFLCDAISRMEKVAEQGSAIATAVEGVDGEIDLQIAFSSFSRPPMTYSIQASLIN